jgi:FAD/FMN-containing dehydrogenase
VTDTPNWHALDRLVKGTVYLPGSPGFRANSDLFNRRYTDRRPAAVLSVACEEDIRTAIRWTRDHGVDIVPRSGGHSFAGYSVNDGLVIDMSRMSFARADEGTGLVTVGGGTRVGHVYDVVRPHEMAFATGTSPLVGVAGLALGGGGAFASRKFGLTLDAMVATTIITADGETLTCDEKENPDLFWACRGAGGGNFGIHTSFVFQARPVSDVTTFEIDWNWPDAMTALRAVQQVLVDAPDELSIRLGVNTAGTTPAEVADNRQVGAVGQFMGPPHELAKLLGPLRATNPRHFEMVARTYWEANRQLVHATSGGSFAMRNNYAKEKLPDEAFDEIRTWVSRWPGSTNPDGAGIGMFAWGGQINRVAPDATAFVHRDTLFLASMDTGWHNTEPADRIEEKLRWLDGFHAAMRPHLSAEVYQNFPDPDLEDWSSAYYGANYDRLVEVKRKYDPDNVFRYDQSIGSDR